ncbi:flagellar assembly protein FliW [Desulfovibrio sp. OttesenSCG-928-G15]|nr:flagellar assembly protein FliW [Desulfovibrio sp. OttesenSCG-928-G15]
MDKQEVIVIESRLGKREVSLDKVITFPRGVIGFEDEREFILLRIHDESPLLVLQSMTTPTLGLIVADPFTFVPDYTIHLGDADQTLLKAESANDIAVLVTVAIPPGKPEDASLHLLGPIVINHQARLGLQAPQVDRDGPANVRIHTAEVTASAEDDKEAKE